MKRQVNQKIDFTGQDIYIGIDSHKKSWGVSIYSDHFEHKTYTQPVSSKVLYNYLTTNFPNANYKSVYEAGFSGFWIDRELRDLGIDNIVVNPADVPTSNKDRKTKTDRVDARKLAKMLRSNSLTAIYVPDKDVLEDRQLLRFRQALLKDIRKCKCRIKSQLMYFGVDIPEQLDKPYWSKAFKAWLRAKHFDGSAQLTIISKLNQLEFIEQEKRLIEKAIVDLSKTKYNDIVTLLRSIPGIGILTAMTLVTELVDIKRFKRIDELHSFVGLTPNVYSSGDKEFIGSITKRSNRFIRPIIMQSAWRAVKVDPQMLKTYHQLCGRMKGNKAIIKIAKKIMSRVRYVWINQKELN